MVPGPGGRMRRARIGLVREPGAGEVERGTTCPECRTETGIDRGSGTGLGALSLDEVEILVRGEWRWRLGRRSYHRPHPVALIRALAAGIVYPESPIVIAQLETALWGEVAPVRAEGRGRREVRREMEELLRALAHVLVSKGGVDPHDALVATAWLRGRVAAVLSYPSPSGADGEEDAGPRG